MSKKELEIRLLDPKTSVRTRPGMYVGDTSGNASVLLREIIDNSTDEANAGFCQTIYISSDLNGWNFVGDNGRGIPITFSKDKPTVTQAYLSISELHSGSKFNGGDEVRAGMNGIGSSAVQFLSEDYILMSKITEDNYDKSISDVKELWDSCIRSKKDLFYVVACHKGDKIYEGALKLKDIEKRTKTTLPEGCSTMVLFKPDPEMWGSTKTEVPVRNLYNFLTIQEKFFKRKVDVIVDGVSLKNSHKPYKFEICKTIIPVDTTLNKQVGVYITFEADGIEKGNEEGSVNGLSVDNGIHMNLARNLFKTALKDQYKIKHDCLLQGFSFKIIILANEVVFDSQTKTNLRSISKVVQKDFIDIVKEFEKIFRKYPEYWDNHVDQLEQLADSMKKIGASDKAQRMMDSNTGASLYKSKKDFVKGFVDATAGQKDRWDCECFVVEGLSAGQGLVSGRPDTKRFAVLPLRGKILNVTNKTSDAVLDSQTIYSIFNCIGLGIDENNVLKDCKTEEEAIQTLKEKSRYGKIVIATDNDPDGSAIANELLHLFGKFSKFLINSGMIYRALGPLFKGISKTTGKEKYFFPDDPIDPKTGYPEDMKSVVAYYKGLGSLDADEVEDIFYNPMTRRLIQITPEGMDYMMKLNEDIDERKKLLFDHKILSNPYNFKDL